MSSSMKQIRFRLFTVSVYLFFSLSIMHAQSTKPCFNLSLEYFLQSYDHVTWAQALKNKQFLGEGIISGLSLLGAGRLFNGLADFIRERPGQPINDIFLKWLKPRDMSVPAFCLTYPSIALGIFDIIQSPVRTAKTAQLVTIVTLLRLICIALIPLEPPEGGIRLDDPIQEFFFYKGKPLRKDLFFSGHTANLLTFFFVVKNQHLKNFFLLTSCLVGFLMLVQHGHYTIDVLGAPFFVWLASKIVTLLPHSWSFPDNVNTCDYDDFSYSNAAIELEQILTAEQSTAQIRQPISQTS